MKVLLDINLSPLWKAFLEEHEIPATHWSSIGDPRASDRTLMEWAVENRHLVFTHDLDYSQLLALTHARGPSVIQLRTNDVLPDAVGSLVVDAIRQERAHLEAGALVVIDQKSRRVRVLPI